MGESSMHTQATLFLGPADHGRRLTAEEFEAADWQPGYHYELIRGELYVSPLPDPPQDRLEVWLFLRLALYAKRHPRVINYVTPKARVFVAGEEERTRPEPDITAFKDYPLDAPFRELNWRDFSPVLVVEVLSEDAYKDLVRNVELYLEVPTIREYWILDGRKTPDHPTMRVYRRRGQRWQKPIDVAFGEVYTTRLLPGFKLRIDPRR
jgi:Uma2 family endonuclease